MSDGILRPTRGPAKRLYDAFQAEALLRKGREVGIWIEREQLAVWAAARDYAQQHGRPVPTLEQIKAKEQLALGHTDYGSKWALGVAELLAPARAPHAG